VILLLDKKNENKNSIKLKFSKYEAIETGLDDYDLKLLIDLYLKPEFKGKKISNEKSKVL